METKQKIRNRDKIEMNISILEVLVRRERLLIAVVQADFKCVKVANKKSLKEASPWIKVQKLKL